MADALEAVASWLTAVWLWGGWTRLADLAAVATALSTLSIALYLQNSRSNKIRSLERYLAELGRKIGNGENGFRSEEHLSRRLGIPLDEIGRLAHSSKKLVSTPWRLEGATEDTLVWGHRRYVRLKK